MGLTNFTNVVGGFRPFRRTYEIGPNGAIYFLRTKCQLDDFGKFWQFLGNHYGPIHYGPKSQRENKVRMPEQTEKKDQSKEGESLARTWLN